MLTAIEVYACYAVKFYKYLHLQTGERAPGGPVLDLPLSSCFFPNSISYKCSNFLALP